MRGIKHGVFKSHVNMCEKHSLCPGSSEKREKAKEASSLLYDTASLKVSFPTVKYCSF